MVYKLRRAKRDNFTNVFKQPGCYDILGPTLDRNLKPKTGIDPEEIPDLEKKMNVSPGYLALDARYWKEVNVILRDGEQLELDDQDPEDYIKICFLKQKKQVANGSKELKEKPEASFILYTPEQQNKEINKSNKVRREANKQFSELTEAEKRDMLYLYGSKPQNMDEEAVEAQLYMQLESNPDKFLELLKNRDYEYALLAEKLIMHKIIVRQGSRYMYDEQTIAVNKEQLLTYLMDKDNKQVKTAMEAQLLRAKSGQPINP